MSEPAAQLEELIQALIQKTPAAQAQTQPDSTWVELSGALCNLDSQYTGR